MIHHLHGHLAQKSPTSAVVDVGGVGYGVAISLNTYDRLPAAGETVRLQTHTYVREDRFELFGFAEPAEREMFQLLITVSGIGPNSALTILSGLTVGDLQRVIEGEDVAELTRVRGVGPKTARRVVVELKDKVRLSARLPAPADGTQAAAGDSVDGQAATALQVLGFAPAAAQKAVAAARKKIGDDGSVQELIKLALRER